MNKLTNLFVENAINRYLLDRFDHNNFQDFIEKQNRLYRFFNVEKTDQSYRMSFVHAFKMLKENDLEIDMDVIRIAEKLMINNNFIKAYKQVLQHTHARKEIENKVHSIIELL